MFKNGFRFRVKKNGIIGEITGYSAGIYGVAFFKDGEMYYMADVHEGTIVNNLKYGYYEEI
jgi:hypothetical protein